MTAGPAVSVARTRSRQPDAGFTLIETLVALAILAMSAMAVMGATQAHVQRIGGLEVRAAAGWAAENHLAELTLGAIPDARPAPILGVAFAISEIRTPTSDLDLDQVRIVATDLADNRAYGQLTGFVLRPSQP